MAATMGEDETVNTQDQRALRLSYARGMGIRQVASSLSLPHRTVSELLQRAVAAGLTWPLPEDIDDTDLVAELYPGDPEGQPDRPAVEWGRIHLELRRKGNTPQLRWFEYRTPCLTKKQRPVTET